MSEAVIRAPLWYVIATRSRHEKVVDAQLRGRNVETFLPLAERWTRWKDRRAKVQIPLFPGYCFARFPLTDRVRVLSAPGVLRHGRTT
jgi:transcription antitermination factor NusG